jgi:hypothetical protein
MELPGAGELPAHPSPAPVANRMAEREGWRPEASGAPAQPVAVRSGPLPPPGAARAMRSLSERGPACAPALALAAVPSRVGAQAPERPREAPLAAVEKHLPDRRECSKARIHRRGSRRARS